MGLANQVATISLILLFALDVFTDVATGVELILNDKPFCEFLVSFSYMMKTKMIVVANSWMEMPVVKADFKQI